ncbi:hypothetical protein OG943_28675 [Amycolatopsis sp. NBC_00345]|uniref:hypothetical protein n=1 Tax=Amycolatopsis sp. NBC_00345 TaxID=2975955 RepID=UPI002E26CD1D
MFLKIDADPARADVEVEAMAMAPIPEVRLVSNGVLPADLVTRNREVAEAALRPWTPVFTHGDLQIAHVFVEGDVVAGYGFDPSSPGCEVDVLRSRM